MTRCSKCDAELEADLAFCDRCGARVGDVPATQPATGSDGAVRKTVTVLFADLGGSTSFGERTDAELARVVMARYHAILQEVIDGQGGTIAKFMGDGMMALFGIPEIAEDDAVRAVRAGVDAQRRFERFAAEVVDRHGETLTLRVGINTGEVVIGDGDADLVGDALNVAARLEKACTPGHVLVGEETWRLCRDAFNFERLGDVTVAGRTEPVAIYEVATGATASEPAAPFVGRVAEMERVRDALTRAVANRSAQLVTVLGSPGVGKTRLAREVASNAASDSGAKTFEIRCDRAGDATFAPITQLIREAAGLDDEATADDARDRISALLVADSDRARLTEVLAGVFGAAAARSVEETFWAIRRLVESLAATRPVVIVIDDIQWAEPKLLDLLEHLAEWIDGAAVMLLCLARPELREVRPSLVEANRRVADVVALDGLDHAATAQLAAGLLGTDRLPADLIERLPESTDGNPLFVRELVRMLVHDAVIRRRANGEWELTIDADAVEVPPTIQSLLAARVERLPADERHVLELASVIGAEFSLGVLRELAAPHVAVPALLEAMRRKELVEPTGTYLGDEPVHRFHHVLIRDAAYRRLLKGTRAELHQRVGEWTDATAATQIGEHDAAIAFHFEQAYRYRNELGTVDADTDRLGLRAAQLLSAAAQRALERDDLGSAGSLARRALGVLPESETARGAELLVVACESLLSSGDVVTGAPLVEQLRALAGPNEQLGAWAACFEAQLIGLTDAHALLGADAAATAAAATFTALGDGPGEAKAQQVRAGILARLGRIGEAESVLDLALAAARAADDPRRVTLVLGAAPIAALFGPSSVARAGGRCLDVVRLLRITTASPSVEATSMRCQAVLEALRGRFDVSRSMLAASRASLEELGLRHGLLETDLFSGMVELIADNAAGAIAPLRAAYEGLGTLGVGADAGQAAALLARALLEQGNVDEADGIAAASEELAGQNLKTAIAWRIARAEVLATRGDLPAALAHADAAVEIAAATDLILDHGDACVALARLRERAGDNAGALQARAEALRLYVAKGATTPAARLAGEDDANVAPASSADRAPTPTARPADTSGSDTSTRTPHAENAAHDDVHRAPAPTWAPYLDTAVVRLITTGGGAEAGGFTEDVTVEDRRRGVSLPTLRGADAVLENTRAGEEIFGPTTREPIATRGERLVLVKTRAVAESGFELASYGVFEMNDAEQLCAMVFFDDDDLTAALTELDTRYLAGEGAKHLDILRVTLAFGAASDREEFDAMRELLSPDLVVVDHQPLGFGQGDREYFIEASRTRTDVAADGSTTILSAHATQNALVFTRVSTSITYEGNEYERVSCTAFVFDESRRISRAEWFEPEQWVEAKALCDDLGAPRVAVPPIENAATRLRKRYSDAWSTDGLGDLSEFVAPQIVRVDNRAVVGAPDAVDREGFAASARAFADAGYTASDFDPIAVRGERLALGINTYRNDSGFTTQYLALLEIDTDGRMVRVENFDESALDAALDMLEELYVAGEGAAHEYVVRRVGDMTRAERRNDRAAWEALFAPERVATAPKHDARCVPTMLAIRHAAALVRADTPAFVTYRVVRFIAGLVTDMEVFAVEDHERAAARFAQLTADPRSPDLDSAMMRSVARLTWLDEFDPRVDPVGRYHPDCVLIDNRRSVNAGEIVGRAEVSASIESGIDVFGALLTEPIAVRGDRHMLITWKFQQEGGFHTGGLSVIEADESYRLTAIISFDYDDRTSAIEEFESRYRALAGDAYTVTNQFIADHEALCVKSYSAGNVVLAVSEGEPRYGVVVLDDRGRATRVDSFDEHEWTEALARFDDLSAS